MLNQYEGVGNTKVIPRVLGYTFLDAKQNNKFAFVRRDNKFKAFAWLFFLHYEGKLLVKSYNDYQRFFGLRDWDEFYDFIKF